MAALNPSTPLRSLLIIEDEDDIRRIAQLCLERIGRFHVVPARSGEEGVRLAHASPPDAILLDVMMPDLDGPATLRLLKDSLTTRAIPVVFLTARGQSTDRDDLQALGVAGVLAKPFDPLLLPGQVAQVLGW